MQSCVGVFSPFPDFITNARRELMLSAVFLAFLVGAIVALVRESLGFLAVWDVKVLRTFGGLSFLTAGWPWRRFVWKSSLVDLLGTD